MTEPIRVLLVEDHRMFADALVVLLKGEKGIESAGAVTSGEEAVELCRRACPHVVLMDIDLPEMDGIEATRRVLQICPEARVVAITALQPSQVLSRVIEAGASGFLPKTQAADQLVDVIRRAAAGEMVLPAGDLASTLLRLREARRARSDADVLLSQLTRRELEVLQQFAQGKTVQDIANALFISAHTVNSHVRSILTKLGVHSKLEAVLFGLRHGAIRLPSEGDLSAEFH